MQLRSWRLAQPQACSPGGLVALNTLGRGSRGKHAAMSAGTCFTELTGPSTASLVQLQAPHGTQRCQADKVYGQGPAPWLAVAAASAGVCSRDRGVFSAPLRPSTNVLAMACTALNQHGPWAARRADCPADAHHHCRPMQQHMPARCAGPATGWGRAQAHPPPPPPSHPKPKPSAVQTYPSSTGRASPRGAGTRRLRA